MKLSIFVGWICVQILSTQCDAFFNYLNASDVDVATKVCIQKTINHLFSYEDTLSLILDNDICEDAIFYMNTTRPYISLNLDTVEGIKLQYEGQFIICPVDVLALNRTIDRLQYQVMKNSRGLGNSKILVITNTTDASFIFEMFWTYGINNVIILIYGQGILKLCMCDRYSPENACGETAKLMIYQNCEEQVTFSFTNVIRQMNKCPIKFMKKYTPYSKEKETKFTLYILHVIQELSNHRNGTFQRGIFNDNSEFMMHAKNKTNVAMTFGVMTSQAFTITEPLVALEMFYFVPKAQPISNLNAFVQVFSCNVWIAVGVTLICTWLTWFVIISWNGRFTFTFEKLGLAFISVWSLTICGCIAQFPKSFALRITLLSYLIYVIHIQCALTSNMANILTTPRYGFQISNLEELAESGIPIYTESKYAEIYFSFNETNRNHTLYNRLRKQLHPVPLPKLSHIIDSFNHSQNLAFISSLKVPSASVGQKTFSLKEDAYIIKDNSNIGCIRIRLILQADHYFAPTLNSLLRKLAESGIDDKLKKDFMGKLMPPNTASMEENDEELTLPHLIFIFIFLGLGLSISCVVFCLEHVVHKFM